MRTYFFGIDLGVNHTFVLPLCSLFNFIEENGGVVVQVHFDYSVEGHQYEVTMPAQKGDALHNKLHGLDLMHEAQDETPEVHKFMVWDALPTNSDVECENVCSIGERLAMLGKPMTPVLAGAI